MTSSNPFGSEKIDSSQSLLKNQAYKMIRNAIISGNIRQDAIYSQEFISQQLGISRTPVREALLQMQSEGIVIIQRGRGIKLATPSNDELRHVLELSHAVESHACWLAAERIHADELATLEELYESQLKEALKKNIQASMEQDHAFHIAITTVVDNPLFTNNIKRIHQQLLLSGILFGYSQEDLLNIAKEHRTVLDALHKRSPCEAMESMRLHINSVSARTLGSLKNMSNTPQEI